MVSGDLNRIELA